LTIDHVIPISRGGKWEWENLVCSSSAPIPSTHFINWVFLSSAPILSTPFLGMSIFYLNFAGDCLCQMQLQEGSEDTGAGKHEAA
jgi:hypothetical protein